MDTSKPVEEKPRVVVCAAIKNHPGYVVIGPRHFDQTMCDAMNCHVTDIHSWALGTEGFIDQFGVFMTREEAWGVAKEAGQIKYRCGGDEGCLFSENLY